MDHQEAWSLLSPESQEKRVKLWGTEAGLPAAAQCVICFHENAAQSVVGLRCMWKRLPKRKCSAESGGRYPAHSAWSGMENLVLFMEENRQWVPE